MGGDVEVEVADDVHSTSDTRNARYDRCTRIHTYSVARVLLASRVQVHLYRSIARPQAKAFPGNRATRSRHRVLRRRRGFADAAAGKHQSILQVSGIVAVMTKSNVP